jgi:uncharacterized protein (DUF1697 family)
MKKHIAFMRAISVAGHAIVKMTDLKDAFTLAGCEGARTYIQSGNVIFQSPEEDAPTVFKRLRDQLRDLFGNEPGIMFRTIREVERMVERDPFKGFETKRDIKLYVAFLSGKPPTKSRFPLRLPKDALEAFAMKNLEVFIVSCRKENGFYGFPSNFIEKELGVSATSRNWSTVSKIVEFVRDKSAG